MADIGDFIVTSDGGFINAYHHIAARRMIQLSDELCRQIIAELREGIEAIDGTKNDSERLIKSRLQTILERNLHNTIFE